MIGWKIRIFCQIFFELRFRIGMSFGLLRIMLHVQAINQRWKGRKPLRINIFWWFSSLFLRKWIKSTTHITILSWKNHCWDVARSENLATSKSGDKIWGRVRSLCPLASSASSLKKDQKYIMHLPTWFPDEVWGLLVLCILFHNIFFNHPELRKSPDLFITGSNTCKL